MSPGIAFITGCPVSSKCFVAFLDCPCILWNICEIQTNIFIDCKATVIISIEFDPNIREDTCVPRLSATFSDKFAQEGC